MLDFKDKVALITGGTRGLGRAIAMTLARGGATIALNYRRDEESALRTLDEVREADILLHVVDVSHPRYEEQLGVVNKTLQELSAFDKPILVIFNKIDLYETSNFDPWLEEGVKQELLSELRERWERETNGNCVFISATERRNIDDLRRTILEKVRTLYKVRYPYKSEFLY